MALYECVYIARQDISASQVESLTEAFSKIIDDNGGQVSKKEYWGLRTLAYRIKKNRKGHYVLMNLDAPSEAVHEMERNMRINDDVIRYLTLRVKELEEGPSIIMQNRGGRDERGGRGDRRGGRYGDRDRDRDRGRSEDSERGAPARKEEPAAAAAAEGDKS